MKGESALLSADYPLQLPGLMKRARSPEASADKVVVRGQDDKGVRDRGMVELWRAGKFCDVELVVEGRSFNAHRVVLAATSPCLAALLGGDFAEARSHRIELQGHPAPIMERVLDFVYLQECTLLSENELQPLLNAACHFQIASLQAALEAAIIARLDASNCLRGLCLADALTLSSLRQSASDMALKSFDEAARAEDGAALAALPAAVLGALLARDELEVEKEDAVLRTVKTWLAAQQPAASAVVVRGLLEHVRYPLIDDLEALERDELLLQHPDLVMRAYRERLGELLRGGEPTPRTRRRNAPPLTFENLAVGMMLKVCNDLEHVKAEVLRSPGLGWRDEMALMVGHVYKISHLFPEPEAKWVSLDYNETWSSTFPISALRSP